MNIETTRMPSSTSLIIQVWRRNFLQFKKSWLINVFWIVLEPLFYLVALGYGVGAYVDQVRGVSYADFFFPALLCVTSMFVSFFVSTYDTFSKLSYQKIYKTMILTPITPREIVLGEILWGASKGLFSAFGVTLVASLFGHVDTWLIFPALGIVFITAIIFSALGLLVTSWVRNFEMIIYATSGFIVPMSLFSGTYFPIEELPLGLEFLCYLFPLTHAVACVRELLLLKTVSAAFAVHLGILVILALVLTRYAIKRIDAKLTQ